MKFALLLTAGLLACAPACTFAADTAPAVAKPEKALKFLAPDILVPQQLLAAPATPDSADGKAELDEVRTIVKTASAQRHEKAQWDNDHEDLSAFYEAVPGLDADKLPATKALFTDLLNEEDLSTKTYKSYFARKRPFQLDPSIAICKGEGTTKPTSYPSGHTTLGYTIAVVLSNLIPDKAPAIFDRAGSYGYSRLVCGVHFRSDIVAGQVLGTYLGTKLLENPRFQAELEASRSELKAAGLKK